MFLFHRTASISCFNEGTFFSQGAEPRGDKDVEVWSSSSADTSDSGHGGSELDVSAVKVTCISFSIISSFRTRSWKCFGTPDLVLVRASCAQSLLLLLLFFPHLSALEQC